MKNLKRILVVAVMLGTLTGYANDGEKVKSIFNYVAKGSHISVSDTKGEVIYSGQINYNGNLTTLFDFTQLKNGKYVVEINKDFEIEINTIEVKNHTVYFLDGTKKKIHKPVVRAESDKVLISKLATQSNEMKIELYYNNELIHSETVKGEAILNRVYKLDSKLKGDYTAVVKSDNRVFVENFRI